MPDRDPLPEFCRYSLWKEYQGVAMHFNDLLLRLRSQSLAAVAAFAAIASAILRNSNESAPLWGALTAYSACSFSSGSRSGCWMRERGRAV